MICREIIDVIERKYARSYAMSWDNVGLLCGRFDKEVKRIYVALDAIDEVIEQAIEAKADMLVTHHPLIMSGINRITDDDFIGKRLIKLIRNDISYYAMHTNYDVKGMAELASDKLMLKDAEVLEVTGEGDVPEGIGRIANLSEEMTLRQCCELVKDTFSLDNVKVFGNLDTKVTRMAICPGSGKSFIKTAVKKGADVYVTGDIGHHDGIDAVAQNLAVIDAGHYGVEHIFIKDMAEYLEKNLEDTDIQTAEIEHPFTVI